MTVFAKDARVRLNAAGITAYGHTRQIDWAARRGWVEEGNPRGGSAVRVLWDGLNGAYYVPSEYLELHTIGNSSHCGLGVPM
jgi:hypothetical protein